MCVNNAHKHNRAREAHDHIVCIDVAAKARPKQMPRVSDNRTCPTPPTRARSLQSLGRRCGQARDKTQHRHIAHRLEPETAAPDFQHVAASGPVPFKIASLDICHSSAAPCCISFRSSLQRSRRAAIRSRKAATAVELLPQSQKKLRRGEYGFLQTPAPHTLLQVLHLLWLASDGARVRRGFPLR